MMKIVLLALLAGLTLAAQGTPDFSESQKAVLIQMNSDLDPQQEAVTAARTAMTAATFGDPRDNRSIEKEAAAVESAELTLAMAQAEALAKIQASADKLDSNQLTLLAARGNNFRSGQKGGPTYGHGGTIPNITQAQVNLLTVLTDDSTSLMHASGSARAAVTAAAFTIPRNDSAIRSKAEAVKDAELALAKVRADSFAKIQTSGERLAPEQVAAFRGMGGSFANVQFTQPDPMDFSEHNGYVPMFDGATLKGWDGNPKFWRVEDGAIVGESTPQNPSGNSYLVYRDVVAKDFTLKFEIKVEGTGGSGFQYRSKTGIPWLANIADNVTANVGPVNLNWMLTGPQADFWPDSRDWTGQFYSENTPMRILAWRGQVVEGAGLRSKELMGNIGDRQKLGTLVKMNDWNQYTVIARGGTLIQILNGQLMAVMVDDDPQSSNNQPGLFGIEIEATTKVSVRNIWLKKIN